jgi:excisionase family DNA binding protein
MAKSELTLAGSEEYALDIPTAARRTNLGRSNIINEIESGNLRSIRIGRRRLILPEDLRAWLLSRPSVRPSQAPMTAVRSAADLEKPLAPRPSAMGRRKAQR